MGGSVKSLISEKMKSDSLEALSIKLPTLESKGSESTRTSANDVLSDGSICIIFSPGPVGLELQPVIISSEREIGCRVKDYYFGIDYHGIPPDDLQASVSIGDIITHIDSRNVQSAKFSDILGLLRSLKDSERKITFKNVSNSCQSNLQIGFSFVLVGFVSTLRS